MEEKHKCLKNNAWNSEIKVRKKSNQRNAWFHTYNREWGATGTRSGDDKLSRVACGNFNVFLPLFFLTRTPTLKNTLKKSSRQLQTLINEWVNDLTAFHQLSLSWTHKTMYNINLIMHVADSLTKQSTFIPVTPGFRVASVGLPHLTGWGMS